MIDKAVRSGYARLCDLDEKYGVKDLYDLAEIIDVEAYNNHIARLNSEPTK